MWLARVELEAADVVVTSAADGGPGSLRQVLADLGAGGGVRFDPALAGQTVVLTSGPLVLTRNVTIDASDAPGIVLSGNGADRIFIVDAGTTATVRGLTVANGFGFDLAGGILNNGALTLDECVVRDNRVGAATAEFWKGGGGIYSGGGSTLVLRRSTVRGNSTQLVDGGGLYAFLGATVTVDSSTIEGNTAGNVGGGLRSLGNVTLTNTTLSGNTSLAWYVSGNTSGCFAGFFGSGPVVLASGGHNVASDATCNLTATGDQPGTDPLLLPLGANGGPTRTHALFDGSPAIDAADAAACPPTDQRGVSRPQGAGCDVGAFER